MPKQITEEIRSDRRLNYVLLLDQIIQDAGLLMEYARMRGWNLEETFEAVDSRIREMRAGLKA